MSSSHSANSNSIDSINWIEESISKKHIKYYEYKHFSNIQEIGAGGFGKVFRAYWKNSEQYLALKSFFNLDNAAVKELVHELELHRDVDFHNNIIRFYGITTEDQESRNGNIRRYLLVMEYADGGSLNNYLKKNFKKLTWREKFDLAYQLSCAVLCLHDEGIVHHDLHSGNVLVHQHIVKLADFGLSKRIEAASKCRSKLFGIIPYVDPKRFSKRRNSTNMKNSMNKPIYSLNEKSDVYSIGVLLWEISSGKPPFYNEDEPYDIELAMDILQGHREKIVPGTPKGYAKLYTECWDNDPDHRPTMSQVVARLKEMISLISRPIEIEIDEASISSKSSNEELFNSNNAKTSSSVINPLQGELSQIMQNLDQMNTNEIIRSLSTKKKSSSGDISSTIAELIKFISRITNEQKEQISRRQYIINYLNGNKIDSREICNWLLNNQNNSDYVFLLGYFTYFGIETRKNYEIALKLFKDASDQNHPLAQYYVGLYYYYGYGIAKDERLAFKYFQNVANKDYAAGQLNVGYCYYSGIGVKKDLKMAKYWYKKASNNGNIIAIHNLGLLYLNEKGINKDYNSAFDLFQKSCKEEYLDGILMLGYCYESGIGTNVNKKKAFELYQRAAKLGHSQAQYNLAFMYEFGYGTTADMNKAKIWYKRSAEQEHEEAKNRIDDFANTKSDDCKIS